METGIVTLLLTAPVEVEAASTGEAIALVRQQLDEGMVIDQSTVNITVRETQVHG